HLDDGECPHQVEIALRHGMVGKVLHGESRTDELRGVHNARLFVSSATFDAYRRANRRECRRLHTDRLFEIHDRLAEKPRQVKMRLLETVDAGVMRIVSGVVVDIDARKWHLVPNNLDDVTQQASKGRVKARRPGPCTIVVFLVWQGP